MVRTKLISIQGDIVEVYSIELKSRFKVKLQPYKQLSILLVGVVCLFFIPFEIKTNQTFWGRVLDVGHIPAFFLISWVLLELFKNSGYPRLRCLSYSAALTTAAILLTELIQPLFGRNFEVQDILNGLYGVALACFAAVLRDCQSRLGGFLLFGLVTGVVIGFSSVPALRAYETLKWRQEMFPVLALFESPLERSLWRKTSGNMTIEFGQLENCNGSFCLKVVTAPGGWSGVEYSAECLDWSQYKFLSLLVHSEDEFIVSLRVDDDGDVQLFKDRFNGKIKLRKGENLVTIPISQIQRGEGRREINVKCITRMIIFAGDQQESKTIYIANVRLL